MNLIQYLPSTLWSVVCLLQSMVLIGLIHVVSDLEKLTQRKQAKGWSFQKKGWVMFALWCVMMPGVLAGGREVSSQYQERQLREASDNAYRIKDLERDVKELKDQLASKQADPK